MRVGGDNRRFMEAILWRVRTGAPWRDLPREFGKWHTVFKRFRRWAKAGIFESLFDALNDEPTSNMFSSTARLSRPIKRVQAQKGASASGHRAISWRVDNQDRDTGGWAREYISVLASAGTGARYEGGCSADPLDLLWGTSG